MSAATEMPPTDRSAAFFQAHGWWLLLLAAVVAFVPSTLTAPMSDSDESRFSGATLEMMRRGEWVVPYFNGEDRFDKPPLTYWCQRLSFAVFGVNEFAARFHSIAAATGIALLILRFGRRLFSSPTAFLAALGWLTCVEVRGRGRLAVAEMLMLFCIVLSQWAIFELIHAQAPRRFGRWFWALYLAQAAGFLAKGPVVLAVSLLTLLLFRWILWRRPVSWSALQLGAGLPLTLAIVAAWGVPALLKTDGLFWNVGMGHHVLDRGLKPLFEQQPSPFFYLRASFWVLVPWVACTVHGFVGLRTNWNPTNAFLLSWFLAPYLIFSFYATQISHYILPAAPAFLLIVFQRPWPESDAPRWERAWFWGVLVLVGGAAIVVGFIMAVASLAPEFEPAKAFMLGNAGALLCLLAGTAAWRWRQLAWWIPCLLASAWCQHSVATASRSMTPSVAVAHLARQLPPEADTIGLGYSDAALVFYSGRVWHWETDWESLQQRLDAPAARCAVCLRREVVLDRKSLKQVRAGAGLDQLTPSRDNRERLDRLNTQGYERLRVSGLSIARESWVELEVFYRR